MNIRRVAKKVSALLGLGVMRRSTENLLLENNRQLRDLRSAMGFLTYIADDSVKKALDVVHLARAQFHQDMFVLTLLDNKKNGYFVEFGATDGMDFSNTWLLEQEFGWQGILAEPGKCWHGALHRNRRSHISEKCVWKVSNEQLVFNETDDGGFSTIDHFSSADRHRFARKKGIKYRVDTISLHDLLMAYDAPKRIDYLSLDTEGSEYDILSTLNFDEWDIAIISVEHNFNDNRDNIKRLLEKNDYERVLTTISNVDDWYVRSRLVADVKNKFTLGAGID